MTVTNQDTDASAADTSPPKQWRPWPVLAAIVVAIVGVSIVLAVRHANRTPTESDSSTTEQTAADVEADVIDACQRSILARAEEHPVLGDPATSVSWESGTAERTGVGRYTVEGTVRGTLATADWRFAYNCRMAAEQSGDGSGRWAALDNSFEPQ